MIKCQAIVDSHYFDITVGFQVYTILNARSVPVGHAINFITLPSLKLFGL